LGKCPSCSSWNTFAEEVISKDDGTNKNEWRQTAPRSKAIVAKTLDEIESSPAMKSLTGSSAAALFPDHSY